jgi:hypothetical protein
MKTSMHTPDHLAEAEEEMAHLADSDGSYMSVGYLQALTDKSGHLLEHIDNSTPLPDWVEAKISQAANAINSVHDFYEFSDGRVRELTAAERKMRALAEDPDGVLARFEEGVPADPTENMSEEDAAEWERQNEKNRDKFKTASIQYRTLADAALVTGDDRYGRPGAEVWYSNSRSSRDFSLGSGAVEYGVPLPNLQTLEDTHVFIGRVATSSPEEVFSMMQGERWSPDGEGRSLIVKAGTNHTSMMVGDVIKIGSKMFLVDRFKMTKLAQGKRIQLTPKEIALGDDGWTIVVRPQAGSGYMVAAVHIETGEINGRPDFVEKKSEIARAVADQVRWLSKMGVGGAMADASRTRNFRVSQKADIDPIDRSEATVEGALAEMSLLSEDPKETPKSAGEREDRQQVAKMIVPLSRGLAALDFTLHESDKWERFGWEIQDLNSTSGYNLGWDGVIRDYRNNHKVADLLRDGVQGALRKLDKYHEETYVVPRERELGIERFASVRSGASEIDQALGILARFEEGKSVDVPKYLREKGNPEAAEEWEQNVEEYGDKFKTARRHRRGLLDRTASEVGKTILEQMGGTNRLKAMLGVNYLKFFPDGVEFAWPNKERSKGNLVRITLDPDDTYKVEFFNHSMSGRKPVRRIEGVYNDMLVNIFEKQTGWYLRLGSRKRLTVLDRKASEFVNLWAAVANGNDLLGVTDVPAGKSPVFWKAKTGANAMEIIQLKDVPIDVAEILADQGTPAQFYSSGVDAWKMARRYAPANKRASSPTGVEEAILAFLSKNGGGSVEITDLVSEAAGLDNTHFKEVEAAANSLAQKGKVLMEGSRIKEASRASGLYGFTKRTQSDCEAAVRKLTKAAVRLARDAYGKDEEIAPFLATHVKRANSLPAKILVDTLKNMGPKVASQIEADVRTSPWSGWTKDTPVQVDSAKGSEVFQNLASAQERYPELDPKKGSENFGWAEKGEVAGDPALVFKAKSSMGREAARKDWGLYGFRSKTANLGLHACTALREAAGQIAADLHGRRADSHEHITGFLKSHAKEGRCAYSRMLGASYPDADRRCASAQPQSVADWLAWED